MVDAVESLGDEYVDEIVPACDDPKDDRTCLNCKHFMLEIHTPSGKLTTGSRRCRKFISLKNSEYAPFLEVRLNAKYCGGKLFERGENGW